MTYLPPQETEQVSNLLSILADPKKIQAAFVDLAAKAKEHDQRSKELAETLDQIRSKENEISLREKAVQKQQVDLSSREEIVGSNLDNLNKRITSFEEHRTQTLNTLASKEKELKDRETAVTSKEVTLVSRDKVLQQSEERVQKLEQKASELKQQFEDKLSKLKAIV